MGEKVGVHSKVMRELHYRCSRKRRRSSSRRRQKISNRNRTAGEERGTTRKRSRTTLNTALAQDTTPVTTFPPPLPLFLDLRYYPIPPSLSLSLTLSLSLSLSLLPQTPDHRRLGFFFIICPSVSLYLYNSSLMLSLFIASLVCL